MKNKNKLKQKEVLGDLYKSILVLLVTSITMLTYVLTAIFSLGALTNQFSIFRALTAFLAAKLMHKGLQEFNIIQSKNK